MPTQTATTGQLENAQNVVIAEWRLTAEHNAPCIHLIDRFKLGKGEKTYRFPKVGQTTFSALTDGQDMVDSQSIGLTYVDASPSEVGAKFILTDKLVRQASDDAFRIIGRQLGDGMARKRDQDIITLFASLDYAWGADNAILGMIQAMGVSTLATTYKFIKPIFAIHHPNALGSFAKAWSGFPGSTAASVISYYINSGANRDADRILRDFFAVSMNGITWYHDGNIAVVAGTDSSYGCMASKGAMALVESLAPTVERERDASFRATEVNMVADYIAVEVDGTMGASLRYEQINLRTT